MKKLLSLILLFLVCLILLFSFGCGSRKTVTSSTDEITTEQSAKATDVKQSASTTTTQSSSEQSGVLETNTTTTDYTPMVDPQTGEIVPVKTREETTTTKQAVNGSKQETKQEVKANTDIATSQAESKQESSTKKREAQAIDRTSGNLKYVFWILIVLVGVFVWLNIKPPDWAKKIRDKIKAL